MQTEFKPKKSLKELEAEARVKHQVKLLQIIKGKTYATFVDPGMHIKDRSGRVYVVGEDGAVRRIKPK